MDCVPYSCPFQEFDYTDLRKEEKEIKLHSVDLASLSTAMSRTGYFSRNNSHSKLSLILEDDEQKPNEEEKKNKGAIAASNSNRKIGVSLAENFSTVSARKISETDRSENSLFKQKTAAPKQKMYLVKRNNKKNEK